METTPPPFLKKIELQFPRIYLAAANVFLRFVTWLLFGPVPKDPKNILIYKIGNIGDIVCAIPSFVAIRRFYPSSKITLLTSPGNENIPGAKELVSGAWYMDEVVAYSTSELNTLKKKADFIRKLRKEKIDLFVHIPTSNYPVFKTIFRNLIFVKLIKAKSAFGFEMRGLVRSLFRKTQIDYINGTKESEALLELLRRNGIKAGAPEFSFVVGDDAKIKITKIFEEKWGRIPYPLITLSPGGKLAEKRWPEERFRDVAVSLQKKYNVCIVILGGKSDLPAAHVIQEGLDQYKTLNLTGELNLEESLAVLQQANLLIANDSGLMHVAAGVGKPTVSLFSILNTLGDWFPYGDNHEVIFRRFLDCNYRDPGCIKRSMELITVNEVLAACERQVEKLLKK